jgi:hypothetical protein
MYSQCIASLPVISRNLNAEKAGWVQRRFTGAPAASQTDVAAATAAMCLAVIPIGKC